MILSNFRDNCVFIYKFLNYFIEIFNLGNMVMFKEKLNVNYVFIIINKCYD